MPSPVQQELRRETAANVAAFTGAQGELIYKTDAKEVTVHDGSTPGGRTLASKDASLQTANALSELAGSAATARGSLDTFSTKEADDRAGARGVRGGVYFYGVSGSKCLVVTKKTIGTGGFSIWIGATIPSAAADVGLGGFSSSTTLVDSFGLRITSGGALRVTIFGATTSDFRYAEVAGVVTNYGGKAVDVMVTRDDVTGAIAVYINGAIATVGADVTGGSAPAWAATVNATNFLLGLHDATQAYSGRIFECKALSFAASAALADVCHRHGLPPQYATGDTTPIIDSATLNGGFETGGGSPFANWTASVAGSSTVTSDASNVHSGSAACKFTVDGSNSNASIFQTPTGYIAGQAYIFRAWAKASVNGVSLTTVTTATFTDSPTLAWNLTTSYAQINEHHVANSTSFGLKRNSAASASIWIDDVFLQRAGAIFDLNLAVGIGTTVPDKSANYVWAELSGTYNHVIPLRQGRVTYTRRLAHSDISSTAATTALFTLPNFCSVVTQSIDVTTAFDATITESTGISGTPARYVSARAISSTGVFTDASATLNPETGTSGGNTVVYVQKSGATTVGVGVWSVTVEIKG
jgi:hypothetical protein